jgi:hypothetical protein
MHKKYELIVVFKKGVDEDFAIKILKLLNINFENRSDSSRGKVYFYNHGPQLLLKFSSDEEINNFQNKAKEIEEIFEIYKPNWNIAKD